jgi:hypothetical protein
MSNNQFSSMLRSKLLRASLLILFFLVSIAIVSLSGSRVSSQTSTPPQPPQARNELKPVTRLVNDAKRNGRQFPLAEPFNRQTRSAVADLARSQAVRAGTILQLRRNALADLVNRNPQSLTLRLPTFGGPPVELELVQVNLFAEGFKVVTSDSNGRSVPNQPGVHYWGLIKGDENSLAAISIFKDEVIGTYSSSTRGNFVLGKISGNNPARDHILYAEQDLTTPMPFECDTPQDNTGFAAEDVDNSSALVTRCVKVFVETDLDLFQDKGSVDGVINYVTGFFNQTAALFSNESIPISISEIFVWTTPSPYSGGDSLTQLIQFQNFRTSFNGDIAHLVDLQSNQGGRAAGVNGFCNPNRSQSQCYSGIFPFFADVPTYSWTVNVFAHEMGHLFGSQHTHACVWNGNNTAIDGCGPADGFPNEGSCPVAPLPSNGGTIMSYCHRVASVGINFANGFGPQPGNVIRNGFNNAGCLGTCGQPDGYPTAFQSVDGHFVVAEGGGGSVVNADRSAIGSWETFTLIDLNGGSLESGDLVNIQSVGGYFVVAEGGGGDVVNANRTGAFAWETFRIEKVGGCCGINSGDTISLQAYNGWNGGGGNYVVAEGGGGSVVNANRAAVGAWETFTIHIF